MESLQFNRVFITVGTTDFDDLIQTLDTNAHEFIDLLVLLSCSHLSIQIGRGKFEPSLIPRECISRGIECTCFRFKPNLDEDMQQADLILSHCGAGSILEALSLRKTLIVIVNDTLQGNHQTELALQLAEDQYCLSTSPRSLLSDLRSPQLVSRLKGLKIFPNPDYDLFPALVDSLFEWET